MSISFQDIYSAEITADWVSKPFSGFSLDSRHIQSDQIFIALNSYSQPEKTREFAQSAIEKGALAVISEQSLGLAKEWVCPDVRRLFGEWQKQYLVGIDPIQPLSVIAVTGTNGKTTISRLVAELIHFSGQQCAVMGTTGNGILPNLSPSSHTTLDALQLQTLLHDYAKLGATFAALEASSHGLEQGRLNGCEIKIAIYSNLSRDHLDYHGTFDSYASAKAKLFQFPQLEVAIINQDDLYASKMIEAAQNNPNQPRILTYSITQSTADYWVSDLNYHLNGAEFILHTPISTFKISSPLLGHFNVENLVASLVAFEQTGLSLQKILPNIPQLKGAPGRMQVIADQSRLFVVDYAHTPDALTQVLQTLRRHTDKKLWVVFGCGGDRDRGKRPLMTQAALDDADILLLTMDNPRTELPDQIFVDMKYNLDFSEREVYEIRDRREAIRYVVEQAQPGDIVVIAGKGHENYQEINGVRHWFDDVVEVQSAITHAHSVDSAYPAE